MTNSRIELSKLDWHKCRGFYSFKGFCPRRTSTFIVSVIVIRCAGTYCQLGSHGLFHGLRATMALESLAIDLRLDGVESTYLVELLTSIDAHFEGT